LPAGFTSNDGLNIGRRRELSSRLADLQDNFIYTMTGDTETTTVVKMDASTVSRFVLMAQMIDGGDVLDWRAD